MNNHPSNLASKASHENGFSQKLVSTSQHATNKAAASQTPPQLGLFLIPHLQRSLKYPARILMTLLSDLPMDLSSNLVLVCCPFMKAFIKLPLAGSDLPCHNVFHHEKWNKKYQLLTHPRPLFIPRPPLSPKPRLLF